MVASKYRILTLLALLLIGTIILATSLIALGFFDPFAGEWPVWQRRLTSMQIPPQKREVRWLKEELPHLPFSIRLTAHYEKGELDSGYGLLLSQENGNIALMVSPLGYVAIWQEPISAGLKSEHFYLPWQTWPHVRTGDAVNEIMVVLEEDTMSVRVNREWLWEGQQIGNISRIGVIGESYGGESSISFQRAEILAPQTAE